MMDAYQWGQAEARHDQQMIDDATVPYGEKVVGETLDGEEIHEGDKVIELFGGDCIFDDKEAMHRYVADWLKDADESDLHDMMEYFFDGKREEAEE